MQPASAGSAPDVAYRQATGVNTSTSPTTLGSTGITITFFRNYWTYCWRLLVCRCKNYDLGDFRFDNASMAHVTKFYMSDESRQNIDIQALIRTFDDSTSDVKGAYDFYKTK